MEIKPVEFRDGKLILLDQTLLPHKIAYAECRTVAEVADGIKSMKVRGAPAIGITAAYGLALSKNPENDAKILLASRPTAVDLRNAVDFVLSEMKKGKSAAEAASEWHASIGERCRRIAENGATLIRDGMKIHTHCNTGSLATGVSYGTALGVIKKAWEEKKRIFVFVDETRPRFQGALTSWELRQLGIPHDVIVDSAAGHFMKRGETNMSIVGADRIAANGDFANKIGTYQVAVLAKENQVPFYVAAPFSSFDLSIESGNGIKVEERNESEVLLDIYPKGTRARNPAFDVTPAKYVTAFITEFGIHKKIKEVEMAWKSMPVSSSEQE
ncbi:S-methyl-5-thioribose-1-phosphate isomerase [Candidatus Micrarchaeota archaeon]|nr:S-methyl-5-thioribose-1-phosphate isomerase [Candidatus Micrarchaeota archaeon]